MELLLVRHGEPRRVVDAAGPADPPLHERGVEQATRLARWLADEDVHAVYTSPLQRAAETAEPVAAAHGLEVVVDDELAEFDRDATTYIPVEELRATGDERWLMMVEGRFDAPDIDPIAFRRGVVTAVERIIAAHPGGRVVAVCHGGVINGYIGHVLGIQRPLWFLPFYTSIHRIAASRQGHRSVITLNEAAHLRGMPVEAGH